MFEPNLLDRYSAAEQKLFKALGLESMLTSSASPIAVYRYAAEEAFLHNKQGPVIEALRRGFKEFNAINRVYRMTKEFDALIEFDDGTKNDPAEAYGPISGWV